MTDTLEPSEVAARIKAARLLRGVTQDELATRLVDAGLPWRLAGSLERGEQELKSAARAALSLALGFPERWFADPVDDLCPPEPEQPIATELARIREHVERVLGILSG